MFVIWLWQIAAMVIAVRQVLDFSTTGKAIVVVLIGFVINFVLTLLILAPAPRDARALRLRRELGRGTGVYIERQRPQEQC